MQSFIILSFLILTVIKLSVIKLIVIIPSVVMLTVTRLSVMALSPTEKKRLVTNSIRENGALVLLSFSDNPNVCD